MAASTDEDVFAMISNIPFSFHSQDLRNYFSQFLEERRFKCFHFRNRPEYRLSRTTENVSSRKAISDLKDPIRPNSSNVRPSVKVTHSCIAGIPCTNHTDDIKTNVSPVTNSPRKCCIVRLSAQNFHKFLYLYNKKPWVDRKGNAMRLRCNIVSVNIRNSLTSGDTGTRSSGTVFSEEDLHSLPELNPPDIMPRGNVGTPTQTFLELIKDCKIPPSVIKKLGLTFPKRRSNRQYGNVPFQYGTDVAPGGGEEEEVAVTGTGEEIIDDRIDSSFNKEEKVHVGDTELQPSSLTTEEASPKRSEQSESDDDGDDDDDSSEEWERHEALHDDVTKQDRTEERLFEEEMEIVWDKGSSGLVFYTDAAYWEAEKGDFDERTSDDWDVDMSIFYEKGSGTKDAKDWMKMQREMRLRRGDEEGTSVFTKNQVGKFEKHTKGFGRTVMNKMGWKDGDGLGKSSTGMKDALDNEGQTSKDKRGLGYHGKKLNRFPGVKKQKTSAIISTVYDDRDQTDQPTTLLRRSEPTSLKYR